MGPFAQLALSSPVAELFIGVVAMTGLVLAARCHRARASAIGPAAKRGTLPPAGREREGIRDLHAGRRRPHRHLEYAGRAHQGLSAEEIIGKPFRTFFTPEDVETRRAEQVLRMAREEGRRATRVCACARTGPAFASRESSRRYGNESGALIGLSKVAHDVTDRKQADEGAARERGALPHAGGRAAALVWTACPDGRCDYLSPQWGRYTGIPEEQQLGFGWLEQIDPADRERAAARGSAQSRRTRRLDVEYRIRAPAARIAGSKVRGVPLRDAEGRVVKWFGTNTDIDDQKRANELLEAKVQSAQRSCRRAFPP